MKFEFDIRKCSDVGLVVKYGNSNNVVFFFDENEDAASYSLELYRLDFDMGNNGFLREVCEIQKQELSYQKGYGVVEKYTDEALVSPKQPYFDGKQLVSQREWDERTYDRYRPTIKRHEIIKCSFDEIKPICSISIDRRTFFASVDFLPEGEYICILNVEDRNGEIIKRSMPYYFKVKANADISKQLAGIQSSVRSSGCHVVTN
jgi:hypothetical protein